MEIKIKRVFDDATIPTRGSEYAAGYDLYACANDNTYIMPGENTLMHTGIACVIPHGYFGAIFARSGLAAKQGLRPANCVGVVDEDYRGEIIVALHNDSGITRCIEPGTRIAQLVIMPYYAVDLKEVNELPGTERGDGGFGSTGI